MNRPYPACDARRPAHLVFSKVPSCYPRCINFERRAVQVHLLLDCALQDVATPVSRLAIELPVTHVWCFGANWNVRNSPSQCLPQQRTWVACRATAECRQELSVDDKHFSHQFRSTPSLSLCIDSVMRGQATSVLDLVVMCLSS